MILCPLCQNLVLHFGQPVEDNDDKTPFTCPIIYSTENNDMVEQAIIGHQLASPHYARWSSPEYYDMTYEINVAPFQILYSTRHKTMTVFLNDDTILWKVERNIELTKVHDFAIRLLSLKAFL